MAKILEGRWTDNHRGGVVVFLIGMKPITWWQVKSW